MEKKKINTKCVICGKLTSYCLPSEKFGVETPYCNLHRYNALIYLYENILRYFASCDLCSYELIGEPYREVYINPLLNELGKSIEAFNNDIQKENEILINQMIEEMNKMQM